MVTFRPNDPFPLYQPGTVSLAVAQSHAALVDDWVGLRVEEIESQLTVGRFHSPKQTTRNEKQTLWFGLDPRQLQTPYIEIRQMLHFLAPEPGQTIVDLGCAYGRLGFVLARHYPEVHFIGYEFVGERVAEGNRCFKDWGNTNYPIHHSDISAPGFQLDVADFYFLYDFGSFAAIDSALQRIFVIARLRPVQIIVRGRRCFEIIQQRHAHWLLPQLSFSRANSIGFFISTLQSHTYIASGD